MSTVPVNILFEDTGETITTDTLPGDTVCELKRAVCDTHDLDINMIDILMEETVLGGSEKLSDLLVGNSEVAFVVSLSERGRSQRELGREPTMAELRTALAQEGPEISIRLLLSAGGWSVNVDTGQGRTPLYLASLGYNVQHVKELLSFEDINVNKPDSKGYTPLNIAVQRGYLNVVRLLLDRNDIDLNYAAEFETSPLQSCVVCRRTCCLAEILKRASEVTLSDSLLTAIKVEHREITDMLLNEIEKGTFPPDSINNVDEFGSAAIHVSCERHDLYCLRRIIGLPGCNVNAIDQNGDTALIIAVVFQFYDGVELMLQHGGVDTSIRSSDGSTVLDAATSRGDVRMTRLLRGLPKLK
eukprot:TRINITY_DN3033_c0_g1_i2.p1 TRINITY_DN3033_c0_g1~~TRINITY_DN3033_c0_g1_i2.p1  ORF type:complete len:357 (+),score=46.98 TRINITY_DN3033_c0_g1_i2:69-1139(+)